ncbi:MAG TPA: Rrf2 family transcriptional regulator [Bacteroidota bacterium]|nr:Rrf2 family transcriptional regulator [Bacteroidota bacterium]
MVRLSKRAEYGLIAIRHVAAQRDVVTAKEISALYGIPYELLAKVLQKLVKGGLLMSHQGVHGGYTLARPASEIAVSTIIHAIEGTAPMIAQCMAEGADSCTVFTVCTIKSPLGKVQANIEQAFSAMTLAEIV